MHEILFVPLILFIIIVAPLWLTLHYRYKNRMAVGLGEKEHASIDGMLDKLDKLSDRIETLEKILDEKHSGWSSGHSSDDSSK